MILVLLFVIVCITYYLYIKNHRYLSFGLGCLFFLWYGWYTSYSVFTSAHEPIIITSITSSSSASSLINNDSIPQQMSKQHNLLYAHPNNTWLITIDATQTNIQSTDMPLILLNKNRITVNSNMDKFSVPVWAQSLNGSGLWSDIDYTSGCSARTVNWPAKIHLERIESMASVWYSQQEDGALLSKIKRSLDYWFLHDFDEKDCLMYGGRAYKNCPCGTPGLWNVAWRSQGVDIPRHVGNICLLIYQQLTPEQQAQCIKFTSRSYSLIRQHDGLNLVDMAYNGVSLALLKGDPLLLQDALDRAGNDTVFDSTRTDGIQMDGSYLFDNGQFDNGYYGESYILDLLTMFDLMILDSKTTWLPSNSTQTAFVNLVSGSEWMMIGHNSNDSNRNNNNTVRSPWLWQHSALSQMTLDHKTTGNSVLLNITQLNNVIRHWFSPIDTNNNTITTTNTNRTVSQTAQGLVSVIARLNHTYTSANQGPLVGTRYFWNADYLVHRCHGFVTTLKMVSTRTRATSECMDGQENTEKGAPLLNHGSVFTYQQGADYLDIFGDDAWDWNHVPGTTSRSSSFGNCNNNNNNNNNSDDDDDDHNRGKHAFVGAAVLEQNQMGVAVMNFTDLEMDGGTGFGWQKTFFFFPSVYAIQIDLVTTTNSSLALPSSAVTTTLDQRRRRGDIYMNGKQLQKPNGTHQNVRTLWHDMMLYSFETPVNLTMMAMAGNGSSSSSSSVDLWTPSITTMTGSLVYTVQPKYGSHRHQTKPPLDFISAQGVRGAFSASDHALALAFWAPAAINIPWSQSDDGDDGVDVFIETDHPLTFFLQQQVGNGTWVASVSDPTQSLVSTTIKISVDQEEAPIQYDIDFPQGQMRGSSVVIVLQDEP